MCGLVGVAGKIDTAAQKVLENLLVMDQLRGTHSVGVGVVDPHKDVDIFKKAMLPTDFFQLKGYKELMKFTRNIIIGHNRYATQGAVNSINAHPFEHGDIMGAHNGTLRNQALLPDNKEFVVDSENIIHSIDKIGIEETSPKLNGAYALTWFDAKTETLHMLRNKERPLCYVFSTDRKTLFWASEYYMLKAALVRNNVEHEAIQILPEHMLLTFDIPFGFVNAAPAIEKPTAKAVKEYTAPAVNRTNSNKHRFVPKFLGDMGYNFHTDIDIQWTDCVGNTLTGITLDSNSATVTCFVGNEKHRKIMFEHDGYYQAKICGFTNASAANPNGSVTVSQGSCTAKPWETTSEKKK